MPEFKEKYQHFTEAELLMIGGVFQFSRTNNPVRPEEQGLFDEIEKECVYEINRRRRKYIKLNYRGRIFTKELDSLSKKVDLYGIIEISDWFNGNKDYECRTVEGIIVDKKMPIPEELYNQQINISYGAGRGG